MGQFGRRRQSTLNFAKSLFAACFLLFSVRDVSAGEETCIYENSRYEFSIAASCAYFARFDAIIEADNGDGILLRSAAEGLEIRVYGSLVREVEGDFNEKEKEIDVDPSLEIVAIEQSIVEIGVETRAVLTPTRRNNVTIYAEARSEKGSLAKLSGELTFIVESMRSK